MNAEKQRLAEDQSGQQRWKLFGSYQFLDPAGGGQPARFYRAFMQ